MPLKADKKVPVYCYQCVAGPDLMTVSVTDGVATAVEPNASATTGAALGTSHATTKATFTRAMENTDLVRLLMSPGMR